MIDKGGEQMLFSVLGQSVILQYYQDDIVLGLSIYLSHFRDPNIGELDTRNRERKNQKSNLKEFYYEK